MKIGKGCPPRALRRVPQGRGRHSEKSVLGHFAADHGMATATTHIDGVRRSFVTRSFKNHGRRAP